MSRAPFLHPFEATLDSLVLLLKLPDSWKWGIAYGEEAGRGQGLTNTPGSLGRGWGLESAGPPVKFCAVLRVAQGQLSSVRP